MPLLCIGSGSWERIICPLLLLQVLVKEKEIKITLFKKKTFIGVLSLQPPKSDSEIFSCLKKSSVCGGVCRHRDIVASDFLNFFSFTVHLCLLNGGVIYFAWYSYSFFWFHIT